MSHGIDLVHYLLEDQFPKSVVALGGVFAWPDGRENPDTFHALLEYPKGFLVSYSTSFGNDCDSSTRIMGSKATLINIGGEGSQRWNLVEEKGNHEDNPFLHRAQKTIMLNAAQAQRQGKKLYWDSDTEQILDHPPDGLGLTRQIFIGLHLRLSRARRFRPA